MMMSLKGQNETHARALQLRIDVLQELGAEVRAMSRDAFSLDDETAFRTEPDDVGTMTVVCSDNAHRFEGVKGRLLYQALKRTLEEALKRLPDDLADVLADQIEVVADAYDATVASWVAGVEGVEADEEWYE